MMVFPNESNNQSIIEKSQILKPHVTTIDGTEPMLRPGPSPSLKASSLRVSFSGWRLPNTKFKSWARKMAALHKPTWIKAGISEAIKASTYKIHKNPSLILSLAQKWSPQSKSFVFPWGEATITLEDVTVLLGFSVLGSSVFGPLEISGMKEISEKLEERRKKSTTQVSWISSFVDDQMEHEAFLVLWLSNFVFPDKSGRLISKDVFPIAVRLARGERISLAPAVLASLYRDLGKIHALASTQTVRPQSLFKLVLVSIWERFKSIRPEAKVIPKGEPRIARWSGLKQRFENVGLFRLDDFDWRPYTKPLRNWYPPRFYIEEANGLRIDDDSLDDDDEFVSFARCMRVSKLDGLGFIEDYYPNRVAMQFGLAQDLPGLATKHSTSNFTEKEAWEDYNRPLDGSKQCIPSRLTTDSVTAARYRDWWMKSVSKMRKEPTETFNPSDTGDHISLKVLPLSQIFQKLGDGIKKGERLTKKRCRRTREDGNESDMDCLSQTQQDDEEEDDSITIVQRIKCRKKCGDVKDTGRERSRLDVDYKVSGLAQKPNGASKGVAEKEEDDNITIAQIIKSRKKCGNVEHTEGRGDAYGGQEVDFNVLGPPHKFAYGDKPVAIPELEKRSEENDDTNSPDPLVASNGVAEKKEDDDESLKQRKFATDELALKLEARMLNVEKTLEKIKQWKMTKNHTKTPVSV